MAKYLILRLADRPRQAAAVSSLLGPVSTHRVSTGGKLSIKSNVDEMRYILWPYGSRTYKNDALPYSLK